LKPPGSPQQIGEPGPQLADVAENQPGPSRQLSASRGKRQREKARIYRHTSNTFLEEKIEESRLRLEMAGMSVDPSFLPLSFPSTCR
jgi:hypothetical protein